MNLIDSGIDPANQWFDRLARAINLPDSKYEAADRSYRSVSAWLEREDSVFSGNHIEVYSQGSFRLGTAIQPLGEEEHYDLDIVAEFGISKSQRTQEWLHRTLGEELIKYATRYGMDRPSPWDRCWTLNYAESARFHMDVLPSVPDSGRRSFREAAGAATTYAANSISITDRTDDNFRHLSQLWPSSNPNGYALWFASRMSVAFDQRRKAIALSEGAQVADIPSYRVKTPLQLAVQILKRHRDVYFADKDDGLRPSSVILTTLAAHAYEQQSTVLSALTGILAAIPGRTAPDQGRYYLPNPSDPRENFADAWNAHPDRARAFNEWVDAARGDFQEARRGRNPTEFIQSLSSRLGPKLLQEAVDSAPTRGASMWKLRRLLGAPHRRVPEWPVSRMGTATIAAEYTRPGFRPKPLPSDAPDLPLDCTLSFQGTTDVPMPYETYWQIVNTGVAATDANGLRGTFEVPRQRDRPMKHTEKTEYPGSHSIQLFVVKNGFVAAQSDLFLVNIGSRR